MSNREGTASNDLARRVLAAQRVGLDTLLLHEPLVVGVSGGTDSLALLRLLVTLRGDSAAKTLHVAHLDHGFRGAAGAADACFVEQIARDWGISSTMASFDVPEYARRHNMSAEEAARLVRYSFLATVARPRQATVAVAHNADDQAETVLMHILRGSGLSGIVGMQPLREVPARSYESLLSSDHQGELQGNSTTVQIYRPLLHIWREELAAYCEEQGLNPRVDATNSDLSYRRNRIRHELIPYLTREYSPAVKAHLTDLAELASADERLIKQIADTKWEEIAKVDDQAGVVLFNTADLANLPESLGRRIVRKALGLLGGTLDG
ncbi:MAG: tRNA lysidine(34) synthetase TilS, partial [Chloroflexi bacterium]|nr:tRNA lysidine(34) synthetase TilS [Chloroflexota bacterium]